MRHWGAPLAVLLFTAMLWHGTAARGLSISAAAAGDANPERRLQEEAEDRLLPAADSETGDAAADEVNNGDTAQPDEAENRSDADGAGATQGAAWQTVAAADGAAAEPEETAVGAARGETEPSGVQQAAADNELAEQQKVRGSNSIVVCACEMPRADRAQNSQILSTATEL